MYIHLNLHVFSESNCDDAEAMPLMSKLGLASVLNQPKSDAALHAQRNWLCHFLLSVDWTQLSCAVCFTFSGLLIDSLDCHEFV